MDYFALRGVDPSSYEDAPLPSWLREEVKALSQDAAILDFGCGFGQNLLALRRDGFRNVKGADIDRRALAHCRASGLAVADVSEGFDSLLGEFGSFDAIVTTHVLEHIPKSNVISVLEKLRGLLRPGGVLIVAVPNAQAYTGAYWAYEDFTHETLYTYGSLVFILRAAGFGRLALLDADATHGSSLLKRIVRRALTRVYSLNYRFWKKALGSPTHIASVDVFSYELKMKASVED